MQKSCEAAQPKFSTLNGLLVLALYPYEREKKIIQ